MKYSIFSIIFYQLGRENTIKDEYRPNSHGISLKSTKIRQFVIHDVIASADYYCMAARRIKIKPKLEFCCDKFCRRHIFFIPRESTDEFLVVRRPLLSVRLGGSPYHTARKVDGILGGFMSNFYEHFLFLDLEIFGLR